MDYGHAFPCRCTDPTPVYGQITCQWFCYDCGGDLDQSGLAVLTARAELNRARRAAGLTVQPDSAS